MKAPYKIIADDILVILACLSQSLLLSYIKQNPFLVHSLLKYLNNFSETTRPIFTKLHK